MPSFAWDEGEGEGPSIGGWRLTTATSDDRLSAKGSICTTTLRSSSNGSRSFGPRTLRTMLDPRTARGGRGAPFCRGEGGQIRLIWL